MEQNNSFIPIEIYLSGRNLKDLDMFSKSDPYIKVSYRRDFNCKNYSILGKTETIKNNLNPNYTKAIALDYIFETRQDIKFEIFDDDNGNDDFVGSVETTVGALMGAKNQTSILEIKSEGKNRGKIIARCEKVGGSNIHYEMKWKALKLKNVDSVFDFWDKSDPYIKILKIRSDNSFIQAHKTEYVKDELNPNWKAFSVPALKVHDESSTRFKIECWDYEEDGEDQFIGETFLDVNELITPVFPKEIKLINPKSKKPGAIVLESFKSFTKPGFIDYLKGGLELNMIIAIDFTGSNGSPSQPTSLHYMDPNKPNQYQMAIQSIGQIILNYDSDKKIPSFGFGADLYFPTMKGLSHCFPLSGDFNNVEAHGIEHLMELYKQSLKNLSLSGPTYFGPIIEQVAKISSQFKSQESFTYQTLLILTDGEIHDMEKVVNLIISCTEIPLSIIIVGIGNADFANMEKLDGDGGLYGSNGVKAKRDIVQFVPFRNVQFDGNLLAQSLLAELPNQVVSYFQNQNMKPRPPPQVQPMTEMLPNTNQNLVQQTFNHTKNFS